MNEEAHCDRRAHARRRARVVWRPSSACSSSSLNHGQGGFIDGGADSRWVMPAATPAQTRRWRRRRWAEPVRVPGRPGRRRLLRHHLRRIERAHRLPVPAGQLRRPTRTCPTAGSSRSSSTSSSSTRSRSGRTPNLSATDQSQHGAQVAHLDGPFVVDLHKGGKIVGQGGYPEQATPIGVITSQNDNGNAPFDTSGGTRYGFGFSTVPGDLRRVQREPRRRARRPTSRTWCRRATRSSTAAPRSGRATTRATRTPCTQTNAGAGQDAGLLTEGDASVATYVDGGYDFSAMDKLTLRLHARLSDADQLRQLPEHDRRGHSRSRARTTPRGVVASAEPVDHHAGDRAHGPPLLGELPGGHPRPLGPHRRAVRRLDREPGAGATPRTSSASRSTHDRQDGDAAAVAQLRRAATTRRRATGRCSSARSACRSIPQGTCTGHDRAGLHAGPLPGDSRLLRLHPVHAVDPGAPQLAGPLLHRSPVPGPGGRIVRRASGA